MTEEKQPFKPLSTLIQQERKKVYANYLKIDVLSDGEKLPSKENPDLKELSQQIGVCSVTLNLFKNVLKNDLKNYNL